MDLEDIIKKKKKLAKIRHKSCGRTGRDKLWCVMREIINEFKKTSEKKNVSGEENPIEGKLCFLFAKVGVRRDNRRMHLGSET